MEGIHHELLARTLDDIIDFKSFSIEGIFFDLGIEEVNIDTTIPNLLTSPYLRWLVGIFCVIVLILLFLHNLGRIADAFLFAGIPLILSGLVILTAWLMILDIYPRLLGGSRFDLEQFIVGFAHIVLGYGIALVVVGVSSIAAFIVLNQNSKQVQEGTQGEGKQVEGNQGDVNQAQERKQGESNQDEVGNE